MRASEDDAALRAFSTRDGRAGVLLDFDGTLSPIVARPELAKIRDGARDAIARLVERLAIVAVISGRTPAELEELVAVPGVVLAGLYGLARRPSCSGRGRRPGGRHRRHGAGHEGGVQGRLDRGAFPRC